MRFVGWGGLPCGSCPWCGSAGDSSAGGASAAAAAGAGAAVGWGAGVGAGAGLELCLGAEVCRVGSTAVSPGVGGWEAGSLGAPSVGRACTGVKVVAAPAVFAVAAVRVLAFFIA